MTERSLSARGRGSRVVVTVMLSAAVAGFVCFVCEVAESEGVGG